MKSSTPSHVRALRKSSVLPRIYGPFTRYWDTRSGRLDGDAGLAVQAADRGQPTHSLGRLQAETDERCELNYRRAVTIAVEIMERARILQNRIKTDLEEIARLREQITQMTEEAEASPVAIAATERHLPERAILSRRQRETAARRAPLQKKIESAQERIHADSSALAEERGRLEILWDGTVSRALAIADFFERRANSQARAYLRRNPPEKSQPHPMNTRAPITAPEWVHSANPWIEQLPAVSEEFGG
ncbi:MAG: hypothetical protein KF772_04760 [Cryobacterium sp.]|nr:hypothetical protein [Cryobacterium sp.]